MDPLMDRFYRLLRSMFADTSDINIGFGASENDFDQDYSDAWEELEDFLSGPGYSSTTGSSSAYHGKREPEPPELLRQDYKNLEVPFGADFLKVKKSYKELIIKYHPDRNSSTPENLEAATERAKIINISFQKIKAWETAKRG